VTKALAIATAEAKELVEQDIVFLRSTVLPQLRSPSMVTAVSALLPALELPRPVKKRKLTTDSNKI
jgi:hypothetical protein